MLIYVHVPFCVSKCKYCAFYSKPLKKDNLALTQIYADTLFREIAWAGEKFSDKPVQSVFFGGGTPSILPPAMLEAILNRLSAAFTFAAKPEITLEANPETLRSRTIFSDLLSAGINRLSLGVQSLDDSMLRMLGRAHKAQDSIQAIMGAKSAGFANTSVDLMWGLPGQSIRQWLQTLKEITQLGPDHISCYSLALEPGTAMDKAVEEGSLILPPERDQSLMFLEGANLLESAGYLQYEISNFAKMGFQSRHNMGYWEGDDYLGLGPSSTSTIGNRRWSSPASLDTWKKQVEAGNIGQNPEILTPNTRILELIMLRLRTARGMRLKAYADLTGRDFIADHQKLIQTMHENGLIRIRNGYLSLTRSGMLVSNAIIANLFDRLQETLEDAPKNQGPKKPVSSVKENTQIPVPVIWPNADKNK